MHRFQYPWDMDESPRSKKNYSLLPVSNATATVHSVPHVALVSMAMVFVFALGSTVLYQHMPMLRALSV
ncbi:hypothetical protein FS749_007575 [Ceratobasidium sp. UAMH 11750]|nr:hypothetical protein FS749_007575 [Ceratobasidium sp. UAMH 11750]